jgi:hypothetical protein
VIAQLLAIEDYRIWAIQATGFAVAGLVLMIGRFMTAASQRRSATPLRAKTPPATSNPPRPQNSNRPGVHPEITFRVEDAMK